MARRVAARAARATVAFGALLGGLVASGCSGGGNSGALGHQACVDVQRSLRLYNLSQDKATPKAVAATDAAKAAVALRAAVQPAALAGSQDGSWQALEITLSESNRVNEGTLETALSAQCAQTLSSS